MSSLYPKGAAHLIGQSADVDLLTDNIKILLYAAAYNAAHEFVSDLTGASIIDRSDNLSTKTVTLGVFNADDISLIAVTGSAFDKIIGYVDTGVDATSILLWNMDIPTTTPNGNDINVIWHSSGLFSIA